MRNVNTPKGQNGWKALHERRHIQRKADFTLMIEKVKSRMANSLKSHKNGCKSLPGQTF
jgi:hypothetical protein